MSDPINALAKLIERNRYAALSIVAAVALVGVGLSPGCETMLPSAMTGEAVSPETFAAEITTARTQAEAQARADERSTRRTIAEIQANAERDIAAAIGDAEDRAAEADQAARTVETMARASWETFEKSQAKRQAVWNFATELVGSQIPGLAPFLGSAGIAVALGIGVDNRRKDKVIGVLKSNQTA